MNFIKILIYKLIVKIAVNFIDLLENKGGEVWIIKNYKVSCWQKGYTGIRNSSYRDFDLSQGYSEIQFSSKKTEYNFNESMRLFEEFIENFDNPKYVANVNKAIAVSKYNVDARVWEIVSKDCISL